MPLESLLNFSLILFGLYWAIHLAYKTPWVIDNAGALPFHTIRTLRSPLWPFEYEDISDFQWIGFRNTLPSTLVLAFVHIITSKFVPKVFGYGKPCIYYQAIFGIVGAIFLHGVTGMLLMILILLIFYSLQFAVKLKYILIWTLAVSFLVFNALVNWNIEKERYPARRALNFVVIRALSFSFDRKWALDPESAPEKRSKKLQTPRGRFLELSSDFSRSPEEYNLIAFLAYALYLPLYISGPIIGFNSFIHFQHVRNSVPHRWIFRQIAELAILYIILDGLFTRLLMTSALFVFEENFVFWSLFTQGELLAHFGGYLIYFWAKLAFIWGFFRLWSHLSNVGCPNNLPFFVFNTTGVATFWTKWHVSYHKWIVRYIYLPLGGSKNKPWIFLPVFAFTAIWHQVNLQFAIWLAAMFATMTLELTFKNENSIAFSTLIVTLTAMCNLMGFGIGLTGIIHYFYLLKHTPLINVLCVWAVFFAGASVQVHLVKKRELLK